MMKNIDIDYIIVGSGYAALFFAHQLLMNKKTFIIFSDTNTQSASSVSAGIINPVVLKKFTTFWLATEQINYLKKVMLEIECYLGKNYLIDEQVHRIFHDENEQKLWSIKSQKEELFPFLHPDFIQYPIIKNDFKTGKVQYSSRLNVNDFFTDFIKFLINNNYLIPNKFIYKNIDLENSIYEQHIKFNKIVFCEGIGVKNNPFFSEIPIIPNKGHHIKLELSQPLCFKAIIKKKHFLFPLSKDKNLYFYGGTYDRDNIHNAVDESAIEQLKIGLSEFYPYDFKIKEVSYGFRPTVKDRRPILGRHKNFSNFYVFNGLGARGILNGCYFSKILFDCIENNMEIPAEVNIKRFDI